MHTNQQAAAKCSMIINCHFHPRQPVGSNYLQRSEKLLHVVLKGGHIIDIKTTPMVILTTGVVVDPNDFFEKDIINNLAALLGVAPENIRIMKVVSEGSSGRRRKRATEEKKFEVLLIYAHTEKICYKEDEV